MKKLLALLLTLTMFIPCLGGMSLAVSAEASEHVYMIVTNPGENMDTQMNIGWHADYTYTKCLVEYTTADDTAFAQAVSVEGTYSNDDYLWFEDRYLKGSSGDRFTGKFLDYGVSLYGLKPDTDYIYRICDGEGGYSETYAFKTAGQDQFSIMWLSDMHLSDNSSKATKYQATLDYVQSLSKYDIGLYFNTGDVVSCGDRYGYWQEYIGNEVMRKYTYAATCGNHDLYDSMMKDDSAYTDFWKSTEYFRIVQNYPKNGYDYTSGRLGTYLSNNGYSDYAGDSAGKLFTVDKGALKGKKITGAADSTKGRAYWFIYNRILFIVFDYFAMTYNSEASVAFQWALDVVEQNKGKYDYLFATEHENIIWGADGTGRYYDKYKNFLDTANVDVFFAGDNHIFFRSYSVYNGEKNTDPERGTYFVQAPAITNTSSYPLYEGAVGYGESRYSSADYLGGVMIDVDSEGLHFTTAVATGEGSDYRTLETFDIPKKVRYSDKEIGYYVVDNDTDLYETTDLSSTKLAVIPKGTAVEVYETNGIWCKIRYNGFSGWARLTSEECLIVPATPSTYPTIKLDAYNEGFSGNGVWAYDKGYTKGNGTIANGGWLFSGNNIYTAKKQEDGSYLITEVNDNGEPKNTTPLIDDGILIMCDNKNEATNTLKVGYRFTFDWAQLALNETTPGEPNPEINVSDHEWENTMSSDESGHWYKCSECGAKKNVAPHSYDNDCDDKCDACGYTRAITHSFGSGWNSDAEQHWHQCSVCGEKADVAAHTYTDEMDTDCDVCGAKRELSRPLGDVTGDDVVDNADAAAILRHDAKLAILTEEQQAVADVNDDGVIDNSDAALILRKDAGLIEHF